MKKAHSISILNQKLTLSSESDEAYVREVAEYVSGKIEKIIGSSKSATTLTATLLTCLNLADELFQIKRKQEAGGGWVGQGPANDQVEEAIHRVKDLLALMNAYLEEEDQSVAAG